MSKSLAKRGISYVANTCISKVSFGLFKFVFLDLPKVLTRFLEDSNLVFYLELELFGEESSDIRFRILSIFYRFSSALYS